MIERKVQNLTGENFDVLIIGGGMYGAALVWEAVSRGLSVALIEKNDFASHTSGNSLKIIHGGLRYLQTLDFKRVFESIRERKILMKIAPHLVNPLPSLMPTYGMTMKSKHVMWAGMLLNDLVSCTRNSGMDPERFLPNGRVLSRTVAKSLLPVLKDHHYTGAACWYDGQAYNTERLALSFIRSAAEKGARVCNYTSADDFIMSGNNVTGVKARDMLNGSEFEIRAKMVITTAGPWTNSIMKKVSGKTTTGPFILSKAINLVLKRNLADKYAFGVSSAIEYRGGKKYDRNKRRLLFLTPWREYTVVGTTHLPYNGQPDDFKVSEYDIKDFLLELNDILPDSNLKRDDVTYFHGGVLPLAAEPVPGQDVELLSHYRIVDQEQENGISGLVHVVGVKYTTARDVAESVMNSVCRKLGNSDVNFSTRTTPLSGGDIADFAEFRNTAIRDLKLPEKVTDQLLKNYGQNYRFILDIIKNNPDLAQPVEKKASVIRAEIVFAVRQESAIKLADVVLRRTELGSGERPSPEALEICAGLMAQELGWEQARIKKEINDTVNSYNPLKN